MSDSLLEIYDLSAQRCKNKSGRDNIMDVLYQEREDIAFPFEVLINS